MLSIILVYYDIQKNLQEYVNNVKEEINMDYEFILVYSSKTNLEKNKIDVKVFGKKIFCFDYENFNQLCFDKDFWKLPKYKKVLVSNLKYKIKSEDVKNWFNSSFDGIKRNKSLKGCNIDGRLSVRNKNLMLSILENNPIDKTWFEDFYFFSKIYDNFVLIIYHCYDISKLKEDYISKINELLDFQKKIIITYSVGKNTTNYETVKVNDYKKDVIRFFDKGNYKKLILILDDKVLVAHKNMIINENVIDDMFFSFENINCDVLSPLIYKKFKLIYFGGLYLKNNKKFYFNEEFINLEKLTNFNSMVYSRSTQLHFEDLFICNMNSFYNIMNNRINKNLKIFIDPFIKVEVTIDKYNYPKSNISNYYDINLFKEYFILNTEFLHSFKFQDFVDLSLNKNKKNILIIEDEILVPTLNCGSKFIYEFVKKLLELDYNVYFFMDNFCYNNEWKIQKIYTDKLRKLGVFVNLPNDNNYKNRIELLLKNNYNTFDYIFVSRYHLMLKYYDIIRKYNSKSKLVFQTHDINFLRKERKSKFDDTYFNEDSKFSELTLIKNCDLSIIVSDYERLLLIDNYNINKEKLFYYPIMFESYKDLENYDSTKLKDIYFIGSRHQPNIDSLNYFIKHHFTQIVNYDNNLILHIIGECGNHISKHQNVKIHGVVSDKEMIQIIKNCRLCIIPLLYGAGVKGKLLDAFNYGLPVISSSIGAEGIKGLKDVENIFILENDLSLFDVNYCKKFFEIYNNFELLNLVSKNCKTLFEKEYSKDNANRYVISLMENLKHTTKIIKEKRKKICILYVCYKHKDFHKKLLNHYQELNDTYHYDIYVINNNSSQVIESEDNIFVVEGNNEVYDFSGIDSGIKYLEKHKLFENYDNFIITNETFNKNGPFVSLNNLNYDVFKEVITQDKVLGLVDSFNETFNLDYFSFNSWVRSNFVVMPYHVFMKIKDEILYFKPKNFANIVCDTKLLDLIETHLSHERYNLTPETKKIKICCIFNEYHLTHILRKNGILITDIRNF